MFKKFFSAWENDRMTLRFYQILSVCLVGTLFISIMGTLYVAQNTRVVLVPATLEKSIWVSANTADDNYFTEMAVFFAGYRLNYSPPTVDFQFKNLAKYVAPHASGVLTAELSAIASNIKGKNYSQVFIPAEVRIDNRETHSFIIKGVEKHFVGSQLVDEVGKEYQIVFQMLNGKIFVSGFKDYNGQKAAEAITH